MTLEELRRLHEAGTPGPWKDIPGVWAHEGCVTFPGGGDSTDLSSEDAALIAAMRNHFGRLLDLWEAVDEALDDDRSTGMGVDPRILQDAIRALQEETP